MKLNQSTLAQIQIDKPSYNRDEIGIGIVHFGVGGFHRSHQAMYVDKLFNERLARDWGICGVGVLPADQRMRDALRGQDYLYTLILEHPDGTREPRVIGSIVDFRYAPDDPEAVIELLPTPTTPNISPTLTEGGYNPPLSDVYGLVIEALNRRRERALPSPTIVSCDNIVENGEVARRTFTSYAELSNPALAQWMRDNTKFPNSMVDRITPVTTPEGIERLESESGVPDAWPAPPDPFPLCGLATRFPHA